MESKWPASECLERYSLVDQAIGSESGKLTAATLGFVLAAAIFALFNTALSYAKDADASLKAFLKSLTDHDWTTQGPDRSPHWSRIDRGTWTRLMVCIRLALLLALFCGWLPPSISAATIIVVRHAERVSTMSSADALLTPAGEERARQLGEVLKDANIQRIYVTDLRRTQQTAEPIAARLHLTPIVIAKNEIDALVGQLRKAGDNETVLVVGHSDTVPQIVERLGGRSVPALREDEYDRMILVSLAAHGEAQVVTLRYGNVSH
jgi:broad specificity phosphatase PhoE